MKYRIFFVSSQKMSVIAFMKPHLRSLNSKYSLSVFVNDRDVDFLSDIDVPVFYAQIERSIRPFYDIKGLFSLFLAFLKEKPQAVHSVTPKAGLLAMTAAWLARVPVRVHSFTGQVWVTRRGPMRWLLKSADKCIAAMATDVLVDSPSQRTFLIEQGVVSEKRSAVLGAGSICGVNIHRFCPGLSARQSVRAELGTANNAVVCLYLGRLNHDKGVLDLARAFAQVASTNRNAELWVVGPDEANWFEQMQALLGDAIRQVKRVGFTSEPERFMQAADLFCLPSYREGFGSSVIEAAACGVPALASRIYGLTDAVAEGKTGWMHEAGNVADLTDKLSTLMSNPAELAGKGKAARIYAETVFAEETITGAMVDFYKKRLNEKTF